MSMQALVLNRHNGPLELTSLSRPTPSAGEVLVRIVASGLNPLDLKIRAGAAAHARHPFAAGAGHRPGGRRRHGRAGRHRVQGRGRSVWDDRWRRRHPGVACVVRGGGFQAACAQTLQSVHARSRCTAACLHHVVSRHCRPGALAGGTDGAGAGRRG
jgi:hypothetical protein